MLAHSYDPHIFIYLCTKLFKYIFQVRAYASFQPLFYILCQKLGIAHFKLCSYSFSNTVYTTTRDKKKLFSCLLFNFEDLLTQQTFDSVCIVGRMSVKKCSPQTTIAFVAPTLHKCDAAVRGILPNTD